APTHRVTTAKSNAINGSWPRNSSTPASGPPSCSAAKPCRSGTSTTTTIAPTPPPGTGHQPAASTPASPTSWPHTTRAWTSGVYRRRVSLVVGPVLPAEPVFLDGYRRDAGAHAGGVQRAVE